MMELFPFLVALYSISTMIELNGRMSKQVSILPTTFWPMAHMKAQAILDIRRGVNGDIPCEYRFGADGNIYYFINGVQDKTLYRIADPITDTDVL